jgi:uroporphyrinogen-III decarboxylase
MNGIERLAAVATGEEYDRIPVFCNLLDQGAKELGMPIKDYYSKGEYVAEGQLKMREKYGYDNLWSLFYVGKEAEILGCKKIIYTDSGPPNVGHMAIRNYDDIEKLEVPEDITTHPAFIEIANCLDILKREAKGKYPICAYLTASMTMPAMLMGMEKWIPLLISGPAGPRDELLEKCSLFFRKQAKAYRDAGADILLYSNPFGSTDFVPDTLFETMSLAWMEKDLLPGDVSDIVYYCGGARLNQTMERVMNRFKITSFYNSPHDDIAEAKAIAAGKAICSGVINDIRLIDWSADEIKTEVRQIIDQGMPGDKFIFGTLVMPFQIPENNIRSMLDAAFSYGRYRQKV